ncbi:MAG: ketoacyl-ACP synthase III [Opitutaceae bacterium]|jgi:3-oxoacyl-[acyl-carrier-protein] synthase-3|nr:ketoacyl-ACP synthase III [Opitutaceae bacterium]
MPTTHISILGTGSAAPARVLANTELAQTHRLDTTDEWIAARTGIRERRVAAPGENTSDLAARAAAAALADARLAIADIDLIIVATVSPDMLTPSCASLVQARLGAPRHIPAFDLNAACSGFLYALDTGWAMLASGRYRRALIIGAEKLTAFTDWRDRSTCILFGDAAGAAVLGPAAAADAGDAPSARILGTRLYCEGGMDACLNIAAGGSAMPLTPGNIHARAHYIRMKGREVFRLAVRNMEKACVEILEQHGLSMSQIGCVIPHQANQRIVDAMAKSLGIPRDRLFTNLRHYGNTSAASIPLALDEARRSGAIAPGAISLMVAFGAGLTYGAALVRW